MLGNIRRHSTAVILDDDARIGSWRHVSEEKRGARRQFAGVEGNPYRAGARHRVAGVEDQIQQARLELARIGDGEAGHRRPVQFQSDRRADGVARPVHHLLDHLAEVQHARKQRLGPTYGEQAPVGGDPFLDRPQRVSHQFAHDGRITLRAPRQLLLQQLEISAHHGEQIVEVVGDTGGQTPDGLHATAAAQQLLRLRPVASQPMAVEAPAERRQQIGGLEWLADIIVDAGLQRLDGGLHRRIAGDHYREQVRPEPP
ncbi:hypothetical protein [Ancylobacter dichloromethanicus]|uniref:hypothetical protein n=1 Tax=Ancylobacter dichloromethanicus TaxID=518825 RepID=UPI003612D6D5